MKVSSLNITAKMIIVFFFSSVIPLIFLGGWFHSYVEKNLKQKTLDGLTVVNRSRASHIKYVFRLRHEQAQELAIDKTLLQLNENGLNDVELIKDIQSSIERIYNRLHIKSEKYNSDIDIIGIWDVNGVIIANTRHDLIGQSMPKFYLDNVKRYGSYFGGMEIDPLTGNRSIIILEAIEQQVTQKFIGAVLFRINPIMVDHITTMREGLGKSGETYIVDKDKRLVTESRFIENAELKILVDTLGTQACFGGAVAPDIFPDYRGVPVLSVQEFLPDQEWCILTEIDEQEAFYPLVVLNQRLGIVFISLFMIMGLFIFLTYRGVISPVLKLTRALKEVSNGNYDVRIEHAANDELGKVSKSFNEMIKNLSDSEIEIQTKATELSLSLESLKEQNERMEDTKRATLNILEDLEEEKKKIKESEVKIRTIVETAVDGVIVITDMGIIDSFNPSAERIFGYQAEEVLGKNIKVLMPEPYQSEHDSYINNYKETGKKKIIGIGREVTGCRKDGSLFPMDLSVNVMNLDNGKMFTGIVRDITERKRAEELLRQQKEDLEKVNLELDSFVYTASHDLRAPLRGISSFASFLDEDYRDHLDDEGKEYIQEIRKGAERLSNLIDDLLTLSRISRIKNPFEDVPMNDLITKIVERIEFDIKELNVDLTIQDQMPEVHCDRIKIGEVFLNLINNAIKFASKNDKDNPPKVDVGYKDGEEFYQFYVKDNGIGIAQEHQEQVFGIFKRLHTTKEFEGTGAGLSIVKRVIEDHQGDIWIESELGKGAMFCFTIPKDLEGKKKNKENSTN